MCAIYESLFAEQGRPLTEADVLRHARRQHRGGDHRRLARRRGRRAGRARRGADRPLLGSRSPTAHGLAGAARRPFVTRPPAFRSPSSRVRSARRSSRCSTAAGLADLFATLVTADDVANGKPRSGVLRLLVARLGDGIAPAEVVVFEDTEAGVAAAKGAGRPLSSPCAARCPTSGSPRPTSSSTRSTSSWSDACSDDAASSRTAARRGTSRRTRCRRSSARSRSAPTSSSSTSRCRPTASSSSSTTSTSTG